MQETVSVRRNKLEGGRKEAFPSQFRIRGEIALPEINFLSPRYEKLLRCSHVGCVQTKRQAALKHQGNR